MIDVFQFSIYSDGHYLSYSRFSYDNRIFSSQYFRVFSLLLLIFDRLESRNDFLLNKEKSQIEQFQYGTHFPILNRGSSWFKYRTIERAL